MANLTQKYAKKIKMPQMRVWNTRALVVALLIEPTPSLNGFWQRAGFDSMTLGELIRA